MSHILRLLTTSGAIVLAMILPFLPGRYEPLASSVSLMARVIGSIGLVLVPIGAIWVLVERRRPNSAARSVALGFCVLVWLCLAVAGVAEGGFLLAGAMLIGGVWLLVRARRTLTPSYLIVLPLVAATVMWGFLPRAIESSRDRAIANAAPLIADIERYREAQGHYPLSIYAVQPDYLPGPIGVRQYHYEPVGDSYNVAFEHPAWAFGTQEFVLYNPRDEQSLASHAMVLLQRPAAPAFRRGWYAKQDLRQPHWKVFWFD